MWCLIKLKVAFNLSNKVERNCFGWNTRGGWIGFQNLFQKLVDLLGNSNSFNKLDLYWLYWARQ